MKRKQSDFIITDDFRNHQLIIEDTKEKKIIHLPLTVIIEWAFQIELENDVDET